MDLLNDLYLTDILHMVAEYLLVPTVILLLILIIYALYSVGSLIVEAVVERRYYRAQIPELTALLERASMDRLSQVVDESGLLRRQKDDLDELIAYLYLPEEGRVEVAKRLLANEDLRHKKVLDRTDIAAKTAPMLGLMGTLIPLGPGIIALGTGDVETLSQALLVAFDTTVAGLATAVLCFIVSRIRRRWYADYLVSMEACYNVLLERGAMAHEEGYVFPERAFRYDKNGRKAKAYDIGDGTEEDHANVTKPARRGWFGKDSDTVGKDEVAR